ncbi:Two-component response regulator ORR21 [Bienertia sinuspersici]
MASSNKSKQQSGTNNNDSEFPDGMKVLVVDQSPVCLKLITTLLRKCRYQATEMNNFAEALTVLKQNKDNFDIILTNVYDKGQINGFKLLEAGIEYDIPVIMISASEDVEIIKKGVDHGARDYLVKPVYLPEIKNIWQHVFRKNV